VPVPFVLALLLCGLADRAVWGYRPWLEICARYAPPYQASDPLRTAVRIKLLPRREPGRPAVLLVGSSQIFEGLDCDVFRRVLGGRNCQNLGIAGGSPLDVLFLVDRIDEHAARRVLVTGLFPQTLHREPKAAFSDGRTLACLARGGALPHLTAAEWVELADGQLQNGLETLRLKDSLWDMWDVVGESPLRALRLEIPPQPTRTLDTKAPRPPSFFREQIGKVDPVITTGRFTRSQECALEEVLEGERRSGNWTVVIDFPTRRGYSTTITREAIEHHRRLIRSLHGRTGVVLVTRKDLPELVDEDFHDFTHLRKSGRLKVSRRIAEIVARRGI
jgi:hypothetical protein